MNHREAVTWLADHRSGTLEGSVAGALERHLRECAECREWLATQEVLEALVRSTRLESVSGHSALRLLAEQHPSSDALALCVTRPEEGQELDRADLMAHLAQCSSCRQEVELVREAILQARPPAPAPAERPSHTGIATSRLVAAACALAVLAPAALLLDWTSSAKKPKPPQLGTSPGAQIATVDRVENLRIDGKQIISGDGVLVLSEVQVNPGAQVTLRAEDGIRLEKGFRITDGATIALEIGGGAMSPTGP